MLSPESSAEPGKWRTSRTPYLREIMDALVDPDVETEVVMSSSQVGKTECCLNVTGFYIEHDPAPILFIEPTLDIAEAYSKDRLSPMIRDTASLAQLIADPKSRDSGNTILHKRFRGGHLTLAGSNSPSGLSSRPIRIVIIDEADRCAPSAGAEGDPIALAIKRTTTFWNRKILIVSTPTIKNRSNIEAAFEASDKRYYNVPCHSCREYQVLKWSQVKWTHRDPDSALYICEHCGAGWDDSQRYDAILAGRWQATAPFNGTAGFHIWEAYNPWVPLRKMVATFLAAHAKIQQGDSEAMKSFVNTSLGQTWSEKSEGVAADPLLDRRENYAADRLPYRVLYLTAGVDVQDDRIEIEIVGWRSQRRDDPEESWGSEVIILHGDPAKPEIWDELDEITTRTWQTEDGRQLRLGAACIDSGGHHAASVYKFCNRRIGRHIYAIKGMSGSRPIWPPKVGKSRAHKNSKVWIVGVDVCKDTIYSRLRIAEPGPGYCHFPLAYDREYFDQLTSEEVRTRFVKGHPLREWHKPTGKRNEALDRRAYALAALYSRPVPWDILSRNAPDKPPEQSPANDTNNAPNESQRHALVKKSPVLARPTRFRSV